MMWHLETPRLLLRSTDARDAEAIAALWSDPVVTRYLGGPRDAAAVRADVLQEAAEGRQDPLDALFPLVERSTQRIVGHCGILKKIVDGSEEREVVYVIAKESWGKGYASEAARALCEAAIAGHGVARLIALVEPLNAASIRVAEKIGMSFERATIRPGGRRMLLYATARPAVRDDALPRAVMG